MDYAHFLARRIDGKVQKLAVDAGLTCPNRDGTLGWGGCTYCDNRAFSPSYCHRTQSVTQQLEAGKRFFAGKYPDMRYLAYFQAYTATHAAFERLRPMYDEALAVDGVVGLVIATRPDCVGDDLLAYLQEIDRSRMVIVELGVETMHDRTLRLVNRCHNWATSQACIERVAQMGLTVGAHLILGLPGESDDDMVATVDAVSQLPVSLVKFHQLQVLRGTTLARQVERGEVVVRDWTAEQYAELCVRLVAHLRHDIVVERWVAQAPPHMVITPRWGLKPAEFQRLLSSLATK
ncbi:MAG: TIGR01212 family radical SAM protein [Muribaculaceae bacterium]|nr:TIGR01212 family radical SAM protein [Muribaculaceae bacterium]